MQKPPPMIRKGRKYSVEEIRSLVVGDKSTGKKRLGRGKKFYVDGDWVVLNVRLYTFLMREKGTTCRSCGTKGDYFVKEKSRAQSENSFTLHLYGHRGDVEILMTSDHKIPLAQGGSRKGMKNRQTLCRLCNSIKGSKTGMTFQEIRGAANKAWARRRGAEHQGTPEKKHEKAKKLYGRSYRSGTQDTALT